MASKRPAPTGVRLPPDLHLELTAVAAARGVSLNQLIIQRLSGAAPLHDAVEEIRRDLAHSLPQALSAQAVRDGTPHSAGLLASSLPACVLLEILLLLRQVSGPQKISAVQAELERQGFGVWVGEAL